MDMLQQTLKGFQRILECSLHFLEKGVDFQEFEEKLWETMTTILTLFGDVTSSRTYYKHKDTKEYLHLLDDQVGFGKKKRIDPLLEALVLERTTELSYQKAGRAILPQNQELTVSPEVVRRLVHNLRKGKGEKEGIPREEATTGKDKAPLPLHRGHLMPCPPREEEKRRKRKGDSSFQSTPFLNVS
jgi:hypothetical protein